MHRMIRCLLLAMLLSFFPIRSAGAADIVIGEYGSLTGSNATFGRSTDDGVQLAVKERNAAGGVLGRQIKLVLQDDQGKQTEAVNAVTKLIDSDHVVAIIGEVASSLSLAGGGVCQPAGVPMISPSSTNPSVTRIGDFTDSFQGAVGARFAKEKLGLTKAAILFDNSEAYSTGLQLSFKNAFKKLGGTIVTEQSYSGNDNDYSAQLTAIKNANPDFIYLPGYYTQVVNISRQARKLGITVPFIGGDGWVSEELKNAGTALDGCYFSDHYTAGDDSPEVKQFLKKFKEAYGHEPDSMAALGYDAANLLFDAMTRAGSTDGKALAAAINSTKDFKAVTGTITIDEHRNAKKSAVIQRLKNGEYSLFTRVEPPK